MAAVRILRRSLAALALVVVAALGAWSATALGDVGPPSVPTLPITVTVPPPPPTTLPTPPTPPVTVTVPPVAAPTVSTPPAPVPAPALPSAPADAAPSVGGSASAGSAVSALAGAAGSALAGQSGAVGSGSSGPSSSSGGSSASADGDSAEQQRLSRRRGAAAQRVRGTRNVRPIPARFANRGPNRRSTVIVFWLREPGRVVFTVLSGAPSCRVLGTFAYRGRSGVNRVRYRGRVDGRALPPGRYTLVPRVYRGGSVTQLERVTIQILRPGAKVPLWRRASLVRAECRGDRLAGVHEPTAFGGRFAGSAATASGGGAAASGAAEPSGGVKGATATGPPDSDDGPQPIDEDPDGDGDQGIALPLPFTDDTDGGPPPLLAAAVLTGLGIAIMMLIVLLVKYVRGSWNP